MMPDRIGRDSSPGRLDPPNFNWHYFPIFFLGTLTGKSRLLRSLSLTCGPLGMQVTSG